MMWKEISVSTDSTECSCLRIELFLSASAVETLAGVFAFVLYELRGRISRPVMFCIAYGRCSLRDGGISAFVELDNCA